MAGLIEQQQAEHPPGPHTMPDGTQMNGQQVATPEGDQGPVPQGDDDPAFRDALQFAMKALYEGNGAEGVAKTLLANPSAENLSNVAYKMVEVVDERTQASVPDELLAVLAMQILKEVVDIGEAAGVDYKPSDIATAFRDMILRYVDEQGYDSSQLRAAMEQVDPSQFDEIASEKPETEDMEEPGEPPEDTPADQQEDAAEGESEEEEK